VETGDGSLPQLRHSPRCSQKSSERRKHRYRKHDFMSSRAMRNWKEAWRVTEGLIKQMHDERRPKRARFLMVILSNAIQVYPDPARPGKQFLEHIAADNIFYPNLRLKALAEREQIEFLDLAQPMQGYADQNKVFLHGFGSDIGNGHWNANGHRVAAETDRAKTLPVKTRRQILLALPFT